MDLAAKILITLGGLFLIGLLTDLVGRRTPFPRVKLLLLFGFLIGPAALGLLPDLGERWFLLVADMALSMVGFLLGSKLTLPAFRRYGRAVLAISLLDVLETSLLMAFGLILIGVQPTVAVLLAAMTMGIVAANLSRHHGRLFHAFEGIEWPFMIPFFVLSGASLQISSLAGAGSILAAYIALRVAGRLFGATLGARLGKAPPAIARNIRMALLPQAGVALGMALFATQRVPEIGTTLFPVVITATVFFEVVGPVITRLALIRAGEGRLLKT